MTLVGTPQAVPTYYSTPSPSPSVSPSASLSPVWSVHSSTPSNGASVTSKLKELFSPGLPRPRLPTLSSSSSAVVPALRIPDGMVELISCGATDYSVSLHISTSVKTDPLLPPPPPPLPSSLTPSSVLANSRPPPQPACPNTINALTPAPASTPPLPIERRQHPRRTKRWVGTSDSQSCPAADSCELPPVPALQRQADRKVNFVENLVDSAAQIVETIWKPPKHLRSTATSSSPPANTPPKDPVLPLRTFIQETLRRSRTSYSTLQVALYYLIVIRPHLPAMDTDVSELDPEEAQLVRAKQCGRRMFLAALILASKYLQDRNYSARGWSKISGLNTQEININEMAFLKAIDWKLHISDVVFQRWTDLVLKYTSAPSAGSPRMSPWRDEEERKTAWCKLIMRLSPDLCEAEQLPAVEESPRPRKQPLPSPTPSERSGKRIRCGWEMDGAFDVYGVAQGVR